MKLNNFYLEVKKEIGKDTNEIGAFIASLVKDNLTGVNLDTIEVSSAENNIIDKIVKENNKTHYYRFYDCADKKWYERENTIAEKKDKKEIKKEQEELYGYVYSISFMLEDNVTQCDYWIVFKREENNIFKIAMVDDGLICSNLFEIAEDIPFLIDHKDETIWIRHGKDNLFDYSFMDNYTTIAFMKDNGQDVSSIEYKNENDFYNTKEEKAYNTEELYAKHNIKIVYDAKNIGFHKDEDKFNEEELDKQLKDFKKQVARGYHGGYITAGLEIARNLLGVIEDDKILEVTRISQKELDSIKEEIKEI